VLVSVDVEAKPTTVSEKSVNAASLTAVSLPTVPATVPDAFKNEATKLELVDIKAEPIMELSELLLIKEPVDEPLAVSLTPYWYMYLIFVSSRARGRRVCGQRGGARHREAARNQGGASGCARG
jgi:hypothetical protein